MSDERTAILPPPPVPDEDGCAERYEAGYRTGWRAGRNRAAEDLRRFEKLRVEVHHAIRRLTDLSQWVEDQDLREELCSAAQDLAAGLGPVGDFKHD